MFLLILKLIEFNGSLKKKTYILKKKVYKINIPYVIMYDNIVKNTNGIIKRRNYSGGSTMLNNKKIRVMTKLALYEKKEGKEDIRLSKYYKNDYVRLEILKTIVNVTVGYALILLMIGIYKAEYIISKAVSLDFIRIGQYILGFYIIIMSIYVIGSIIGYSIKYDKSRKTLSKYFKSLKRLSSIYKEEENISS